MMYTASDASRTAQEMLAGISCSTVLSLPDNTEDLISKPAKHNVERRRGDPYNTKAYPYFNLLLNAAADAGRDDCYAFSSPFNDFFGDIPSTEIGKERSLSDLDCSQYVIASTDDVFGVAHQEHLCSFDYTIGDSSTEADVFVVPSPQEICIFSPALVEMCDETKQAEQALSRVAKKIFDERAWTDKFHTQGYADKAMTTVADGIENLFIAKSILIHSIEDIFASTKRYNEILSYQHEYDFSFNGKYADVLLYLRASPTDPDCVLDEIDKLVSVPTSYCFKQISLDSLYGEHTPEIMQLLAHRASFMPLLALEALMAHCEQDGRAAGELLYSFSGEKKTRKTRELVDIYEQEYMLEMLETVAAGVPVEDIIA